MKAYQYASTTGGIEKNLHINPSAPLPTISDNEILVQVHAMALNPVDHKVTEGPLPLLEIAAVKLRVKLLLCYS
jgi:alkaline phosphatase D